MIETIESNPFVRDAREQLFLCGLGDNLVIGGNYMQGQLKIRGDPVYFFGNVSIEDGKYLPKVEVGFALEMDPFSSEQRYSKIEKDLRLLDSQRQESISSGLADIIGEKLDIQILPRPITNDNYPLVSFKGTNAAMLLSKAKVNATVLHKEGVKLAEWYHPKRNSKN